MWSLVVAGLCSLLGLLWLIGGLAKFLASQQVRLSQQVSLCLGKDWHHLLCPLVWCLAQVVAAWQLAPLVMGCCWGQLLLLMGTGCRWQHNSLQLGPRLQT